MTDKPLTVKHNAQDYLVKESDWARLGAGIFEPIKCDACGCTCQGLEPVYPLAAAAAMIPMESEHALTVWLSKNRSYVSQPLRKKVEARWRRYVSLSDICRIREIIFNPFRKGRPPSGLGGIIRASKKLESDAALNEIIRDAAGGADAH